MVYRWEGRECAEEEGIIKGKTMDEREIKKRE